VRSAGLAPPPHPHMGHTQSPPQALPPQQSQPSSLPSPMRTESRHDQRKLGGSIRARKLRCLHSGYPLNSRRIIFENTTLPTQQATRGPISAPAPTPPFPSADATTRHRKNPAKETPSASYRTLLPSVLNPGKNHPTAQHAKSNICFLIKTRLLLPKDTEIIHRRRNQWGTSLPTLED